ncbi:hypothetical protein [Caballeronia arvi]|uniref:hypothetical protein n=1 Tax=Caballeronia arvi TaxID=1777135 RepID=UPI002E145EE7
MSVKHSARRWPFGGDSFLHEPVDGGNCHAGVGEHVVPAKERPIGHYYVVLRLFFYQRLLFSDKADQASAYLRAA